MAVISKYFKSLLTVLSIIALVLILYGNNALKYVITDRNINSLQSKQQKYSKQITKQILTKPVGKLNESISDKIDISSSKNDSTFLQVTKDKNNFLKEDSHSIIFIELALIFTKAESDNTLKYNLKRCLSSLLKYLSAPLRLYLITDDAGFSISSKIIKEVQNANPKQFKVVYVSASHLYDEVQPIVSILQEFFTNSRHSKYKDFLFFFSLFLDRLLPGINNIILMDIDVEIAGDISELNSYFSKFKEEHFIGLCPELTPVYRHILSIYRKEHPDSNLGSPIKNGGFPGYNSGVLLINIPKLKNSTILKTYLDRRKLIEKTNYYHFHGHLGDQDLFTLIAFDHPEIFYTLPCTWNRQLCQWWKSRGYENVFDDYFQCPGEIKLLHGNCKTPIPQNIN